MKYRLFILTAAMAMAVPFTFAAAQDEAVPSVAYDNQGDYSAVEDVAPEAGGQAIDAETSSGYAAEAATDGEDASWAASTSFDGAPTSGTVEDPSALQPQPFSASPNDE